MLYLFDVDGTLRKGLLLPRLTPVTTWDQRILPGRLQRLEALKAAGHHLGAATNQGAIAMGLVTEQRSARIMEETNRRLGGLLEWTRACPHHPRGLRRRYRQICSCRKPAPGMLLEALRVFGVDAKEAAYIGDRDTDCQAAEAAGFAFVPSSTFFARPQQS